MIMALKPIASSGTGLLALLRERNKANDRRVLLPFDSNVGPLHITNITSAKMRGWTWCVRGGYYCDDYGPVADRTGGEFDGEEIKRLTAFQSNGASHKRSG